MRRIARVMILMLLLAALPGLTACGASRPAADTSSSVTEVTASSTTAANPDTTDTQPTTAERTFTLDELAAFDGKNGNPAYVAVDAVVYDVSASAMWREGEHTSCNLGAKAGRDLSQEIAKAPARMRSQLEKFPVVGTLKQP